MRYTILALTAMACGKSSPATVQEPQRPVEDDAATATATPTPTPAPLPKGAYVDLGAALTAIIPADARVVGFGELHNRVDRAQVPSALARFTAALPAIADRLSDLIVETWIVDQTCGKAAVKATAKVETTVKRPEATKSEIALLADAARAAKVQPHAMTLTCADYKTLVPKGEVDPIAMLTLTTRELGRITASAVTHRDKQPDHRPWIAVYGGALHNDRFPEAAVAEWSYAALADKLTRDHFVEVDLIVPELATADPKSRDQPWYPLVETAGAFVQVYPRGDRSYVLVLERTPVAPASPPTTPTSAPTAPAAPVAPTR